MLITNNKKRVLFYHILINLYMRIHHILYLGGIKILYSTRVSLLDYSFKKLNHIEDKTSIGIIKCSI